MDEMCELNFNTYHMKVGNWEWYGIFIRGGICVLVPKLFRAT